MNANTALSWVRSRPNLPWMYRLRNGITWPAPIEIRKPGQHELGEAPAVPDRDPKHASASGVGRQGTPPARPAAARRGAMTRDGPVVGEPRDRAQAGDQQHDHDHEDDPVGRGAGRHPARAPSPSPSRRRRRGWRPRRWSRSGSRTGPRTARCGATARCARSCTARSTTWKAMLPIDQQAAARMMTGRASLAQEGRSARAGSSRDPPMNTERRPTRSDAALAGKAMSGAGDRRRAWTRSRSSPSTARAARR